MTGKKALALAFAGLLTSASAAMAQEWGRERVPRDGACFYKDPNFHGEYFCIGAGQEYSQMPEHMNDKISSIRVFGRAEVFVYRDVRFDGRSSRFAGDISNLKSEGWNDLISSISVRSGGNGSGSGYGYGSSSNHVRPQDADRIIRRAYQDLLGREPDASGQRVYRSRIIDEGWSDAQVRESIRESPEYRERSTMTPARAEDIVRRAYQNVLRREPDSASRGFVDRVMRDHWTQQDVERELRKSPEYRSKG